ncbi:MAG TPA: ABC transporter permease [Candidatus Acidoferrum sp.]|nr:ABC transporter permease [Candidatus Acidoferrum sp.]
MHDLIQEIRFAMRQLRKNPAFAAVAVLTLALGIAANTAIFSVVNGVLLKPLPYKEPDRLVRVWHVPPAKSFPGIPTFTVSAANFLDWQNQNHVFDRMTIYSFRNFTVTGSGNPLQVNACAVSATFFPLLGVEPLLGRTLLPEEDQQGKANVVVLSYRFWREHFGANPGVVGQHITLDGQNFLVAGVMPAEFRIPDFAQLWTPMAWTDKERAVRGEHHYVVMARLKNGVDLKAAQAEMNTISARLEQQYPEDDRGWGATVRPLQADIVGDVRPALLVLLGSVAFVLLIACVNVANLTLAKTFSRQKEIAIRTAMGASSARVLRQILVESVLLAVTGGAVGLVFAHFGVRLIMAFLADKVPHSAEVGLNLTVLLFTVIVSVLTGILAGVLPGLRLSRPNVNQALKQGLGRTDSDSGGNSTRTILVIAEVALSLVLLFGAGLMIRSFARLQRVNPGFDSQNVMTMTLGVTRSEFPTPAAQSAFYQQVLDRVRILPGVQSAGVVDDVPLDGNGSHQPIAIEGRPALAMADQPEVDVRVATPGYMSALHIPIVRGRDFNDSDAAGRPETILISQTMAREFWPNEDPIGKRLTLTFFPGAVREIVGVVGDVKMDGLDQTRPSSSLYIPLAQLTPSSLGEWSSFPMVLVVRTANDPAAVVTAATNAVHEIKSDVPVRDVLSMNEVMSNSVAQQRFNMLLLGVFGALALFLAAIGIYSVLSYSVRRRVQEIGIRLALGAELGDVLRMVVLEGMKPVVLGVTVGIAGAFALGRLLASLIFSVRPTDPITFLAAAALLAVISLFACVIPAYRATRVDPIAALRYE